MNTLPLSGGTVSLDGFSSRSLAMNTKTRSSKQQKRVVICYEDRKISDILLVLPIPINIQRGSSTEVGQKYPIQAHLIAFSAQQRATVDEMKGRGWTRVRVSSIWPFVFMYRHGVQEHSVLNDSDAFGFAAVGRVSLTDSIRCGLRGILLPR